MFYFDPRYMLFMAPAFLLMLIAQIYVSMAYNRWSRVAAQSRFSGGMAAQRLMQAGGLYNVQLEGIAGNMTDHYDPQSKTLRLSRDVYYGNSVAALAIAAHELGHAMQDHEGYTPLKLRSALVPAVNIGSTLGWVLIVLGLVIGATGLAWLGVLVFSGGALFALATLPVELDASARARRLLADSGMILGEEERRGVSQVLNAAALTYVAALFSSVMQLLYYVSLVGGIGGRRDE